ncbi:hypothetical protein MWH30_01060 [Fuchsiella alkaliacetigena]|nr:hypothetical protein [Fuchsiella alkaliacetigena]
MQYEESIGRKVLFGVVLIILLIVLAIYSVVVGIFKAPVMDVAKVLVGSQLGSANTII